MEWLILIGIAIAIGLQLILAEINLAVLEPTIKLRAMQTVERKLQISEISGLDPSQG